MAEKATLLQKLPPVAEKTTPTTAVQAAAATKTEVRSEPEVSISAMQAATYGTSILTFVLAGFAAVVIYRKAVAKTTQSFNGSAKILAAMLVMVSLHGFAATYVYTNYLNQERDTAPLSLTVLVWIIFGAAIGYLGNRLIEKNAKLDTFDAVVDALTYACVFIFSTLAVSDKVGPNIALSLALLSVIAYIIPLSRFLISCKRVKFRRQITDLHGRQLSLYSQVILPIAIPTIALLFTLELFGAELSIFSINIVTSATILASSAVMLISMKTTAEENEAEASAAAVTVNEAPATPQIDPLVTELLAEEAMLQEAANFAPNDELDNVTEFRAERPERLHRPKVLPKNMPTSVKQPRKPEAPKKPVKPQNHTSESAPEPTIKVKAPAKPKKRL